MVRISAKSRRIESEISRMSLLRYGLPSALFMTAAAGGAWAQTIPGALTPLPPAAVGPSATVAPIAPAPPTTTVVETAPAPALAPAPADAPPPLGATVAAPVPVQAAQLRAPDLFSADAGQPTGLPSDLWKGASADLARAVMPMLVQKPVSPAAAAFAHRVMTTPGQAPDGAGQDADLAAARIYVTLSLGDPLGARTMLEHTPGVRQSAALSQVAAEADLVLGREDEACGLGDNLVAGKDGPYWRRLRAYCLLRAGDKPGAQLAYDLTEEQAKDDIYKRLMSAAVAGTPPGEVSLRNGIEYAISRRLQLDLAPAMDKAWAPIATAVAMDSSAQATAQAAAASRVARRIADTSRASSLNPAVRDAALSLADNKLSADLAERLAAAGAGGSMEAQQALGIYAAAGAPGTGRVRAAFAGFDIGRSAASQARLLELDALSVGGSKGDAALLALWLAADAGEAGPVPADRARIIRALRRAGFDQDARNYALEGLLALTPPPPPPPPPPKAKPKPVKKPRRGN